MSTTTDHEDLRRLIPVLSSLVAPRLPETAEIRGKIDRKGLDRGAGERMDVPGRNGDRAYTDFFRSK